MAIGKLHVNGVTYTLYGDFEGSFDDTWQAIQRNAAHVGTNGGNYVTFSIRAGGQRIDLVVRAMGLTTIATWLEDDVPGVQV